MVEYDWLTSNIPDIIKGACDKRIKKLDEKDDREKIIPLSVVVKNIQPSKRKFNVKIVASMHSKDASIEWKLKLKDEYSLSIEGKKINYEFELDGNKSRDIGLEIDTPIG